MVKVLDIESIKRMAGGSTGDTAGSTESGGGGSAPDLSNYVTLPFLRSITWWGRALPADSTDIIGALTSVTDITMTGAISGTTNLTMTGAISGATGLTLNNGAISGATTITASGLATVGSLRIGDAILEWVSGENALKIRKSTGANDAVNVYATGGVSALGYASGGGGGAIALADLVDVAVSSPSSGQGLVYDATASKWKNATLFTAMSYTNNVLSVTVSGVTKQVTIQAGTSSVDWTNITNKPDTATRWPSFSEVTSKPTTINGYGITDAYISSGTIVLGSNSITPLTSESDPTVPAWAKASSKPSYSFSELTSHPTTIAGYGITDAKISNGTITLGSNTITPATQTWVGDNYVSIAFFSRLFQAKNGNTNVNPNDTTSTIDSIKAMFGFWTDQYLSALGQSSGGSGGSTALTNLVDVATSNVSNGQGLVYDSATTKWKNATLFTAMSYTNSVLSVTVSGVTKQVTISTGGGGATTLAELTDTSISSPSSGQALIYNGSKWANSAINLALGGLSNVVLSSPTNGQVLKYNGTNWVNGTGGGGGATTLAGLTDVSISGASGGEVLAYDSSTQKWENMSGYMEETGNTSMRGNFEPASNGGAQLGRSSWRFSYMYGQHGDFSSDLIIGSIKLTYDSTNNALKVQKIDGTAANLYALGSVSALGFGGGPSSTSISQLTLTDRLKIGQSGEHQIYGDSNGILVIDGADGIRLGNNVSLNGYTLSADGGAIELNGGQLYFDYNNTKYIYVSGTHLYFYNGSTTITLA